LSITAVIWCSNKFLRLSFIDSADVKRIYAVFFFSDRLVGREVTLFFMFMGPCIVNQCE